MLEIKDLYARAGDRDILRGISLSVAALGDEHFDIAVIPKTWEMTNLSSLNPGDAVNLEADVIAKYVERMMLTRD